MYSVTQKLSTHPLSRRMSKSTGSNGRKEVGNYDANKRFISVVEFYFVSLFCFQFLKLEFVTVVVNKE